MYFIITSSEFLKGYLSTVKGIAAFYFLLSRERHWNERYVTYKTQLLTEMNKEIERALDVETA